MLRTFARLLLLPIAFLLAAAVAGFVVLSLGQERIVNALAQRAPDESTLGAAFDLFSLAISMLSVQTLLAPVLLVVVGEVARVRSPYYYVLGGGAALGVAPLLARAGDGAAILALAPAVWQVLATAGFAGGFVYWLLAGRKA